MVSIQTVKKGGRNHSLFILNGMQTNTTLHNTITLFHCLDDTIGSSLVLDRLKGPDHHKI